MLEHSHDRAPGPERGEDCEGESFEVQAGETGLYRGRPKVCLSEPRGRGLWSWPQPCWRPVPVCEQGAGAAGCCLLPAALRPRPPRGQWSTATPPRCPFAGPRARDCRLGDGGAIPVCDEGRRPKDVTRTCRRRVVPKRRNRGPRSGRPLSAQPHFRCSLSPPHGPGDKGQSWSWGCGERRQQS